MKVLFLCGSVEPGHDGVGDYTRRLAQAVAVAGHTVTIISLNDSYVEHTNEYHEENTGICFLRMSNLQSWNEKVNEAKKFIDNVNPDWLSLQFVNFSFHSKGYLYNLPQYLSALGKGRKWHIMFHEICTGLDKESKLKFKVLGWLQILQVKKIIFLLKPTIIHTQTKVYQNKLTELGFRVNYLPLFTNIPVSSKNQKISTDEFSLVHFGTIHPGSPVVEFAHEIKVFASKNAYRPSLTLLGRCGKERATWEKIFTAADIKVKILTEQSEEEISKVLSASDLGISTTPIAVADKSGSAAAMWAHGLKIVSVCRPWSIKDSKKTFKIQGIFEYVKGTFERSYRDNVAAGPIVDVSSVANQLIEQLLANQET
jgi:hypothetical protein